jgi:hypothetical protein
MRLTLVFLLAFAAAVAEAQTKIKPGFNLFSPQDDVQVGLQSAQAAEQQLPILNDPVVNNYVNRIGQRLAANAGGPQFQYRFRVVNQSDINAFALPGGFIYVNRGVLDNARNEGEVAGVLAHEISHVALRHGTHQASKAYLAQAGISILGGILGGHIGAGTAQIINAVGGIGLNALFLKYSRDLETQADVRGVQILAASGYSPVDMVDFFRTLERVDPSKKTNWLSDHPAPPDRIARIEREEQMLHVSPRPTENVAELNQIHNELARYGGAPSAASRGRTAMASSSTSGSIGNIPAPASSLRTYTNPNGVYQVSFPSNWRVYQQGGTGVTIAPSGGLVNASGNTDIVTGAMINHYDPFGGAQQMRAISLEDATDDLLSAVTQSSPYLRVVNGTGQRFRMAGGTALAVQLSGTDPATGMRERVTVATRQLSDEHLIYLLFVTPESEVGRYNNVLNEMVGSLRINENARH